MGSRNASDGSEGSEAKEASESFNHLNSVREINQILKSDLKKGSSCSSEKDFFQVEKNTRLVF